MVSPTADTQSLRKQARCGKSACECASPRANVHCPAHQDESPSLSARAVDGKILLSEWSLERRTGRWDELWSRFAAAILEPPLQVDDHGVYPESRPKPVLTNSPQDESSGASRSSTFFEQTQLTKPRD